MDWWILLGAVGGAVLAIGVPGLLAALALRLRGLWAVATAPVFGITIIALASFAAAALHLAWAPWIVAAFAACVAAALWAVTSAVPSLRSSAAVTPQRWVVPTAFALAALLLLIRVLPAIGQPSWFDQAGDNVFHLNAVRWILDHGDASPAGVARMSPDLVAYPSAWHALVALVCQLSGASIPIATNSVLIVVASVVWPLGVLLLTRTLLGTSAPLLIGAGIASAGFAMYPLMLLPYMGTYPLILSIALLGPPVAALAALACGSVDPGVGSALLIAALCAPGIADAHPSAAVMLVVLIAPIVVVGVWRWGRAAPGRTRRTVLFSILCLAVVLAVLVLVRPVIVQPDSPRMSVAQALGELVLGAYGGQDIAVVLGAATILGIVVAVRTRASGDLIALGLWGAVSFIYLAASSHDEFFRLVIAQPWYSDATRVAAFIPLTVAPLAARGIDMAWGFVQGRLDFTDRPRRAPLFGALATALIAALAIQSGPARWAVSWTNQMFTPTDNGLISPLAVDHDDRRVLDYVTAKVPPGELIAGNPWNGSSLAYALTGRPVLVTHLLENKSSTTMAFLSEFATSTETGPGCRAARSLGVKWVLDLHPNKVMPNRPKLAGVANLAESPNVTLVYRAGDSALYRVTGCGAG